MAILAEPQRGTALYGLTNFCARRPSAGSEFLRMVAPCRATSKTKPHPRISTRCSIPRPSRIALSIDDVAANTNDVTTLSIYGIQFTAPDALRAELAVELLP